MGNKNSVLSVNDGEQIQSLLWNNGHVSYPYNLNTVWSPLSTILKKLEIDEQFAFSQFRRLALIDRCGKWDDELINPGIFAKISFIGEDYINHFQEKIELTLLSDRGVNFIADLFSVNLEEILENNKAQNSNH